MPGRRRGRGRRVGPFLSSASCFQTTGLFQRRDLPGDVGGGRAGGSATGRTGYLRRGLCLAAVPYEHLGRRSGLHHGGRDRHGRASCGCRRWHSDVDSWQGSAGQMHLAPGWRAAIALLGKCATLVSTTKEPARSRLALSSLRGVAPPVRDVPGFYHVPETPKQDKTHSPVATASAVCKTRRLAALTRRGSVTVATVGHAARTGWGGRALLE